MGRPGQPTRQGTGDRPGIADDRSTGRGAPRTRSRPRPLWDPVTHAAEEREGRPGAEPQPGQSGEREPAPDRAGSNRSGVEPGEARPPGRRRPSTGAEPDGLGAEEVPREAVFDRTNAAVPRSRSSDTEPIASTIAANAPNWPGSSRVGRPRRRDRCRDRDRRQLVAAAATMISGRNFARAARSAQRGGTARRRSAGASFATIRGIPCQGAPIDRSCGSSGAVAGRRVAGRCPRARAGPVRRRPVATRPPRRVAAARLKPMPASKPTRPEALALLGHPVHPGHRPQAVGQRATTASA